MTTASALRARVGSVRGTVAAGATSVLVVNMGGAAAKFGVQALFARATGITDYGRYVFALGWVQLLAPVATLGYGAGVLAFAPRYRESQDWAALGGVTTEARRTSVLVGVAGATAGAAIARLLGADASLQLAFMTVPMFALLLVQQELLRSHGRSVLAFGLTLLVQPLIAAGAVGAAWLVLEDLDAATLVVATIA